MDKKQKKVVILPCSGIGKAFGSVARETALELVENARPGMTILTCLPLLVINDPDARQLVTENPVITIDGCPKDCAKKSLESVGKKDFHACRVVTFYSAHKDLKPEGIARLNDAGLKLAKISAEELAATVDDLLKEEG